MTGTLINVGAVLLGTLLGALAGGRLPEGIQQRVLAGLGMVTLILGIDNALAWREEPKVLILSVMFAVLLGGIAGELLRIEDRLQALGDRAQARFAGDDGHSTVSEAFFTASLLFCVGPLTVLGSIDDGLRGDTDLLVTKSLLDGFASIALAAALGPGVALAAVSVLVIQGAISLAAGLFEDILAVGSEALAALSSAGGVLIIGIALKLLGITDVKVGNYLPALVFAPLIATLIEAL